MEKQKVTAHVYMQFNAWSEQPSFSVLGFPDAGATFGRVIHTQEIEFDLPSKDEQIAAEVAALQAEEAEALREFVTKQKAIRERIARLTAIGCEVTA